MTTDPIDPAIVERAARAGFAAGAANAAKLIGLDEVVTWDEHLTDDDRERELGRIRAALSAAAPLIAANALREAAEASRELLALLQVENDAQFIGGASHGLGPSEARDIAADWLEARADAIEAGQP